MTTDHVRALLGEPERVDNGLLNYWYDHDYARVLFDTRSGKVDDWSGQRR